MQTFLPLADYFASARALDDRRLGKQRVEAKQILRALLGETRGWRNHPATRMWRGHERALAYYGRIVCEVWRERGFRDSLLPYFVEALRALPDCDDPPWLGRRDVHASHRSNLLRRAPEHYGRFGWREPPDLPYVWPDLGGLP